jgi:prepilin-type processing-associated H-X9-DG protein
MISEGEAPLFIRAGPPYGDDDYSWEFRNENFNFILILQGKQHYNAQWAIQLMNQRHNGRWVMSFCDGHVENMRPEDIFDESNTVAMIRWNADHYPHSPSFP